MRNLFSRFNSLIREAVLFVKEEKLMTVLLLFVLTCYGGVYLTHSHQPKEPSPAMQKIHQAEEQMSNKEEADALKEYILEQAGPVEIVLLVGIPLLLFTAIFAGFILDAYLTGKLLRGGSIISSIDGEVMPIRWGVRDVLKSVIVVLFSAILISILLGSLSSFLGIKKEAGQNVLLILHTVFLDLVILFYVFFTVVKFHAQKIADLGIRFSAWFKDIKIGLTGYVAALPLVVLSIVALVFISELFHYKPPPHPLVEIFVEEDQKNPALIALSILLACTLGPIIEEVFFRGFCYPAFKKRWGAKWGMVLSSAFFACIHNSLFAFFPIFVLGLTFAYVYEKRGSLIPSIVMHIAHNSIFIGYFFVLKRAVLDQLISG